MSPYTRLYAALGLLASLETSPLPNYDPEGDAAERRQREIKETTSKLDDLFVEIHARIHTRRE